MLSSINVIGFQVAVTFSRQSGLSHLIRATADSSKTDVDNNNNNRFNNVNMRGDKWNYNDQRYLVLAFSHWSFQVRVKLSLIPKIDPNW